MLGDTSLSIRQNGFDRLLANQTNLRDVHGATHRIHRDRQADFAPNQRQKTTASLERPSPLGGDSILAKSAAPRSLPQSCDHPLLRASARVEADQGISARRVLGHALSHTQRAAAIISRLYVIFGGYQRSAGDRGQSAHPQNPDQ